MESKEIVNHTTGLMAGRDVKAEMILVHNNSQMSANRSQHHSPVTSFWNVEAPIHTFVGRQDLLRKTHEKLQERLCEKHFVKRMVALVALGGMGKTETARKVAHDYREFYQNVAWIDADSETSATASFRKIARTFNLTHTDNIEGKVLAELVYQHINEHVKKPSLFIFDNAIRMKSEGDVFGIFDFLPSQLVENFPSILLTSQSTEWRMQGCEVIEVSELSKEESLTLLCSRFGLNLTERDNDENLRDLLYNLAERVEGYPLALGLAAANVSYIPGQGSLELLKRKLKKYIQCVDDDKILEQRVNTQLATNYPHTLLKVWDTAMKHLEWREHAREAKLLLSILAYFPQGDSFGRGAQKVYTKTDEMFEVTFPDENDASCEEALHELITVGLVTVLQDKGHGRYDFARIKVHRLVQVLARHNDNTGAGIQKILLYEDLELKEEYLWSRDTVPGWALQNERKALLWVQGLFLLLNQWRRETKRDNFEWKTQLVEFPNGADIALVAEFAASIELPRETSPAQDWDWDIMWAVVGQAVQVRSAMGGPTPEVRVFLELLLLSVLSISTRIMCERFTPELFGNPQGRKQRVVHEDLKVWLSDFDFSTALKNIPQAETKIDEALYHLIMASRILALVFPKIKLVDPKTLLRLVDAKLASCKESKKAKICAKFFKNWTLIWDADDGEELLRNYNLLDHLLLILDPDRPTHISLIFCALGVIRELIMKSKCVHIVVESRGLMEFLSSVSITRFYTSTVVEPFRVYRHRTDEKIRDSFPGVAEGVMVAMDLATQCFFLVYRKMTIYFAICATHRPGEGQTQLVSMNAPSLQDFSHILSQLEIHPESYVEDRPWYQRYDFKPVLTYEPFLTKAELEEDQIMLNIAFENLEDKYESFLEDDWGKSLLKSLPEVRKLNEYLLSFMMEQEAGSVLHSCFCRSLQFEKENAACIPKEFPTVNSTDPLLSSTSKDILEEVEKFTTQYDELFTQRTKEDEEKLENIKARALQRLADEENAETEAFQGLNKAEQELESEIKTVFDGAKDETVFQSQSSHLKASFRTQVEKSMDVSVLGKKNFEDMMPEWDTRVEKLFNHYQELFTHRRKQNEEKVEKTKTEAFQGLEKEEEELESEIKKVFDGTKDETVFQSQSSDLKDSFRTRVDNLLDVSVLGEANVQEIKLAWDTRVEKLLRQYQELFNQLRKEEMEKLENAKAEALQGLTKAAQEFESDFAKKASNIALDSVQERLLTHLESHGILTDADILRVFNLLLAQAKTASSSVPGFDLSKTEWETSWRSQQSSICECLHKIRRTNNKAIHRWDRSLGSALQKTHLFYRQQMDECLPNHKISREKLDKLHDDCIRKAAEKLSVPSQIRRPTIDYCKQVLMKCKSEEWREDYVLENEYKKLDSQSNAAS